MSEGGYSRIEKDFLGNERMVHYDGSGNMLGASDVIREPDGTIRVTNEPVTPIEQVAPPADLPKVEAVMPVAKASIPDAAGASVGVGSKPGMPLNQVVMYCIAAFIATSLLTLGVMSFMRSSGSGRSAPNVVVPSQQTAPPIQHDPPVMQDREPVPDNLPNDPKPRNDDTPPVDDTAPDMNTDRNQPRIDPGRPNPPAGDEPSITESKPGRKPEGKPKPGSDDPIDLRGDGDAKNAPPAKGGNGDDPLRGGGNPLN